jgi:hypothetical protein
MLGYINTEAFESGQAYPMWAMPVRDRSANAYILANKWDISNVEFYEIVEKALIKIQRLMRERDLF